MTKPMKETVSFMSLVAMLAVIVPQLALAEPPPPSEVKAKVFAVKTPANPDHIVQGGRGMVTRSIVAGVCSLILPGVGQAINKNKVGKIVVHFVLGWTGIFHLWSAWDALIDRPGGYINHLVDTPVPAGGMGVC